MTGSLDQLPERVDVLERKLDALSASVDRRFDGVDRRFGEVDKRFDEVDRRFNEVDKRFADVDRQFDSVAQQFVEQRQYTEFAFERLERRMVAGFEAQSGHLERLERKLDQFIDSVHSAIRTPRTRKKR